MTGLSTSARRAVRLLRDDLFAGAALITQRLDDADPADFEAFIMRGTPKGRLRAATRILRLLAPAPIRWHATFAATRSYMLGAYLDWDDPVIQNPEDPGQCQPAAVVRYLVIGRAPNRPKTEGAVQTGLWTLEVPEHALGRAAERDRSPLPDLLWAAHDAALSYPFPRVRVALPFALPAGEGHFAGEWIFGRDVSTDRAPLVYARPRTYLDRPVSVPPSTATAGAALLAPLPLRAWKMEEISA